MPRALLIVLDSVGVGGAADGAVLVRERDCCPRLWISGDESDAAPPGNGTRCGGPNCSPYTLPLPFAAAHARAPPGDVPPYALPGLAGNIMPAPMPMPAPIPIIGNAGGTAGPNMLGVRPAGHPGLAPPALLERSHSSPAAAMACCATASW